MGDRTAKLREILTRERKTPEVLEDLGINLSPDLSRRFEQAKRDSDAVMGWSARVVPLGIALGLVLFGAGWGLVTLLTQR